MGWASTSITWPSPLGSHSPPPRSLLEPTQSSLWLARTDPSLPRRLSYQSRIRDCSPSRTSSYPRAARGPLRPQPLALALALALLPSLPVSRMLRRDEREDQGQRQKLWSFPHRLQRCRPAGSSGCVGRPGTKEEQESPRSPQETPGPWPRAIVPVTTIVVTADSSTVAPAPKSLPSS